MNNLDELDYAATRALMDLGWTNSRASIAQQITWRIEFALTPPPFPHITPRDINIKTPLRY